MPDRADCENAFDELKNQWGWGGFTTKDLKRSSMMEQMTALVYHWWARTSFYFVIGYSVFIIGYSFLGSFFTHICISSFFPGHNLQAVLRTATLFFRLILHLFRFVQ